MANLQVTTIDSVLVVDSRLIASELGIEHSSLIKTIRKYLTEIEVFGQLRFEMLPVTNSVGAVNSVTYCYLNEDQATFVMTLSRNTDQVIKCKQRLVKAFSEAKSRLATPLNLPKTYLDALKALVASEEEKLALQAQKTALESEIKQNAPLVQYAQKVQYSESSVEFHEFAKMIKDHGGRNTVMRKLREMNILMKTSTLPYQKYVDDGYFEVNQEIDPDNGRLLPFATITGKGQIWLHQKLIAHDNLTQNAVKAIAQGVLSFSNN